jgi:hypothetical protein
MGNGLIPGKHLGSVCEQLTGVQRRFSGKCLKSRGIEMISIDFKETVR